MDAKEEEDTISCASTSHTSPSILHHDNALSQSITKLSDKPRIKHSTVLLRENVKDVLALLRVPLLASQLHSTLNVTTLHKWQKECLQSYLEAESRGTSRNLVYAAPTSGGKTLVAILLMIRRVYQGKDTRFGCSRALYILPLRATVSEKVTELTALLRPYNEGIRRRRDLSDSQKKALAIKVRNMTAEFDGRRRNDLSGANIFVSTIEKANIIINDLL